MDLALTVTAGSVLIEEFKSVCEQWYKLNSGSVRVWNKPFPRAPYINYRMLLLTWRKDCLLEKYRTMPGGTHLVELENLNTATDDINKLEIELEEAKSTFRILMNESTRRLKLSSKKLGSCIDKARPYYEALEKAKAAQLECQAAAIKYQRANEIHAAAKETVALAEQRFLSNSQEWQFDNAWQEMLNHATIKVTDAEKQKTESGTEHQKKAKIFHEAELKVQQLEERCRRSIQKSRPYFEEKQLCQEQLEAQKGRIQQLEDQIAAAKTAYGTALRNLEQISEEIHKQRGDLSMAAPSGPREPGVGAELSSLPPSASSVTFSPSANTYNNFSSNMPDISTELDKCEIRSVGSTSIATSSAVSEKDPTDDYMNDADLNLELLRQKVKTLAVRPVEGGDGQQQEQEVWEHELNATVDKLDHLMMLRECSGRGSSVGSPTEHVQSNNYASLPTTPKHHQHMSPVLAEKQKIKMFKKLDPLPLANVSMYALPTYLSGSGITPCCSINTQPVPMGHNDLVTPSNEPVESAVGFKSKRKMSM
ncbi:SH3 domain-binding protein 5 homolog isoform X1 [Wyeomyia smithii]|uniref:SH3 domain-binding protein 5 homolog isoform X1 n=1 Tax=Wyeomyia smithii TaxID=174621 RepID=UPI002468203C|nr:SH3 domain-binding protein 5 homolog isoform X1 [Wyeomyia smithii]